MSALRPAASPWRRLLAAALLVAIVLGAPQTVLPQDTPAPDKPVGELSYTPPASAAARPSAEPPADAPKVLQIARGLAGPPLDWQAEYAKDGKGDLSEAGRAALEVALAEGYGRKDAVADLKNGGEATAPLVRNLDVGRHDIMKALYHRAFEMANQRLAAEKRSPLRRVVPVNAGGTGDFTRDQDITAFAGDEYQEKVYFECLERAADSFAIGDRKLIAVKKETGGIDFPQIEVTVFPGGNDTPDPRFATDVETFKLSYSKALGKQTKDVEAYMGGGTDIEVKGRRRPGQMHVQEIALGGDGGIHYHSETPGNPREARALFTDYGQERFDNWQRASHIFSDYVQAFRHAKGGDHDPTKGPLKYLGRAAEQLCLIQGRKPWKEMTADEKVDTLTTLYPDHSRDNEGGRRILARMADVIDTAIAVKTSKALPDGKNAELGGKIALIFLRKAFAATAGHMARDWLDPPRFDVSMLRPEERARWDAMTPAERHIEAVKRNKVYAECVSHAAMENLVLTMAMLRQMDQDEGRPRGGGDGEAAIRQMIDTERSPAVRAVLGIADEMSTTFLAREQTADPKAREASRQRLAQLRQKLKPYLAPGQEAPGEKLLARMEEMGPKLYLEEDMRGLRSPMGPEMAELKARFDEHMKQAFPTVADEWGAFRADITRNGWKGYAAKKIFAETFQLDSISDCLTLIEMYQNPDTKRMDYVVFTTVNLLSRFHWSFGQFWAAWNVKSQEDLIGLGKGLIFMTLARLVPWAATAKVLFDITAGVVRVTVGWSINLVNADLVDAIYTGEAGRSREDTELSMSTRNRFSGFHVLPPEYVLREKDPETLEERIVIDRPGVYRHFYKSWTGIECDDRHPMRQIGAGANILVHANDRVADLLLEQAGEYDRTWVAAGERSYFAPELKAPDVESALTTLHTSLTNWCRKKVGTVLAEGAYREYRSFFSKADVIEEGLVKRFAADMLAGMIEHWQTYYTAQILAMREIERTAVKADLSAIAEVLRKERHEAIVGKAAPDPKREPVTYRVEITVLGKKLEDADEWDGAEPVRINACLEGEGEVGEHEEEVEYTITATRSEIAEKGEDAKGGRDLVEPGDLLECDILVTALQAGRVLAQASEVVRVRMPGEDKKPGAENKITIFQREERSRDGTLRARYNYFKRFNGMPDDWEVEYGEVLHGPYERFFADGGTEQHEKFEYGKRTGASVSFNSKGDWYLKIPYVNGEVDGTRIHRDPESKARHEIDYRMGSVTEERTYAESGQQLRRVTYQYSGAGEDQKVSGEFFAWWTNGEARFKGRYETNSAYAVISSDRGGSEGGTAPGKTGVWEHWHENGALAKRETFVDNVLNGPFEEFAEDGSLRSRGQYRAGRCDGPWTQSNGSGGRLEGSYRDGKQDGAWITTDEKGQPTRTVVYETGERVRGEDISYHANGRVAVRGAWTMKGREGTWTEWFDSGEVKKIENLREGALHGRYEVRLEDGTLWESGEYSDGEATGDWMLGDLRRGEIGRGKYEKGVRTGRWEYVSLTTKKRVRFEVYHAGDIVEEDHYRDD